MVSLVSLKSLHGASGAQFPRYSHAMPCLASNQVRNLGPLALLAWLSGCVVPLGTTGQPPPNQVVIGPDGGLTTVPSAPDAGAGGGAIFADAGPWINVSSNLAGLASECGNLTL